MPELPGSQWLTTGLIKGTWGFKRGLKGGKNVVYYYHYYSGT